MLFSEEKTQNIKNILLMLQENGENNNMSIEDEFKCSLRAAMMINCDDILLLRKELVHFRNRGMDKVNMLESMEDLRKIMPENDDILCDLMDFISGFCNSELLIFNQDELRTTMLMKVYLIWYIKSIVNGNYKNKGQIVHSANVVNLVEYY